MKTTFYWSLGGHVMFLLVLLISSLFTSCSRNRTPKEVHVFRLQAGPPAQKTSAVPTTTESTPVSEPPVTTPPPVSKPKPKPVTETKPAETKPVQKTEVKPETKPQNKPVSYEEFKKNNPLPKTTQTPKSTPTVQTPPTQQLDPNDKIRKELESMIAGFGGTDTSSDELQELNLYVSQLRNQLDRLWLQPDNLASGNWTASIEFTVAPNGKISGVHFKQKSNNNDFDQSIIRTMNAFVMTNPPPGGKAKTFCIPFTMNVR